MFLLMFKTPYVQFFEAVRGFSLISFKVITTLQGLDYLYKVTSSSFKMKPNFKTYHPNGFHTINAYLFVVEPASEINFLKNAFDAKEINSTINKETGEIANCILKIGDSCFMISQARGDFENM